ncbi:MAG: TonB-dependent receptor [Gemmatimonadales bacterium]
MRFPASFALLLALSSPLAAQSPTARDSIGRDSAKVTLEEITVTVTRTAEKLSRIPAAVDVVDRREIHGAQSTLGLDESLNNLPGVYVANRYNYSLDQRLAIRGAGSRANFGVRGVKVVLDGVPQTLPDGQSQLTNVDFGNIRRIEVLRGASSSLYGNASGGVLNLTSEPAAPGTFSQSIRAEGGSFGLFRIQGRSSARRGAASGTLSLSHTSVDGFRQRSQAQLTQLNLGGDVVIGSATNIGLRFGYTDAPKAQNPGALTAAEVRANPDSAAGNNILRKADKDVSQGQLSLAVTHFTGRGSVTASAFGIVRNLRSPQAIPPTGGTQGPTIGTISHIDRAVGGLRFSTEQHLGAADRAPRVTVGVDLQRMQDDRSLFRAVAAVQDTLLLDQRETVTEVGPFAQLRWSPVTEIEIVTGGRYDAVKFSVDDHHLTDGTDNSGSRTMSAFSANAGLSYVQDQRLSPYVNISTAFETPTTTELANQPNSTGGFNSLLDPQRTVNYEIGARGVAGPVTYSAAGFISRVSNAIVQYREVSGRAYFANAGQVKNDGIELGLSARLAEQLRLFTAYTYSNFRYGRYRIVTGAVTDTLDGKQLPGIPKAFIRFGLRAGPVRGVALDIDHTMSAAVFADDKNTQYVNGWGKASPTTINGIGLGVTNLRLSWEGKSGSAWLRPFLGVNNLWDRTYVSSLTVNATFGRVFEPAPGRNFYLGGEIGWAAQ